MTQSIGGGTRSGMGTLLLLKIQYNYPDRITATFSVYPSPKSIGCSLSFHPSIIGEFSEFKQKEPKYSDLNWFISMVMSGITASLRFSGKLDGDLRKMGDN
eukprot:30466_1